MTIIDFRPLDNAAVADLVTAMLLTEMARIAALPLALTSCDDCIRPVGKAHTPNCPHDGRVSIQHTLAGKGAGNG